MSQRYSVPRRPHKYDADAAMIQATIGWIDLDNAAAILKFVIHQSGKTQVQLAKEIGTNTTTMSAWYRGENVPNADALLNIINACGFDVKIVPKTLDVEIEGMDELSEEEKEFSEEMQKELQSGTN